MSWISHILTTWTKWDFITVGLGIILLFMLGLWARVLYKVRLRGLSAAADPSLSEVSQDPTKPELKAGPDLSSEPKPYFIEIVVISDGKNYHQKIRAKDLNFSYTVDGKNYQIQEGGIFRKDPSLTEQLIWRLRGISAEYMALFWEGETQAVMMDRSQVNPQVLARVRTSRQLGKALREMFKTSILDNRGLVFFFVAFAVIALIILRSMGYV